MSNERLVNFYVARPGLNDTQL